MNNPPLISIVTIARNVREELRRTIESVNAQTHPCVEHVLVDGGSDDGSVVLLRNLARREARWVSEPDAGISDAFNKGTRLATGEWLCYLNAGDVFAGPDVLERVAASMAADAPDDGLPVIWFGDFISTKDGVERRHRTSCAPEDFAWENPVNHQSAFIPRELALEYPYNTRLTLGMDYDLWLRVRTKARFRKLPFEVALFELGGRSSSPAWAVHNLTMRRALWHMNQGTRFTGPDLASLCVRVFRLKLNLLLHRLAGRRVSLALRAAKTRWLGRTRPTVRTFA